MWFSGTRRIEFDNQSWAVCCLTCCLVYEVSEVGSDSTKFVSRVASPDAVRRGLPDRYGQVIVIYRMNLRFSFFFPTWMKTVQDDFRMYQQIWAVILVMCDV